MVCHSQAQAVSFSLGDLALTSCAEGPCAWADIGHLILSCFRMIMPGWHHCCLSAIAALTLSMPLLVSTSSYVSALEAVASLSMRSGISAGDVWPERLREAANRATVVLALIGPGWLTSADEYGRRRLDMSNDWVRNELLTAFSSSKPVIPVLLGNLPEMPPVKALPYELMSLSHYQAYRLTDDHWESDLNELVSKLVNTYEFKEAHRMVQLPSPPIGTRPLTQSELDAELKLLSGWELVENLIPSEYPKARQELTKVYEFRSLRAAINFMSLAVTPFNEAQHHPRWENVWKTLTVYFTTSDIGFRISRLDTDLAKMLDRLYDESTRPAQKSINTSRRSGK